MANWDINRTILTGNITSDAELKYTTSGTAVSSFSIAVNEKPKNDGDQETSFFNCNLWGKGAEAVNQYLTKGKPIVIDGHLKQNRWTDSAGKNQSRVIVVADRVKFQIGGKGGPAVDREAHGDEPGNPNF
jgi:single-strand DNA-binding protein